MFRGKQFVGLLIITLFTARGLIPIGYMLSDNGDGVFFDLNLILCPSQNNFILDFDTLTKNEPATHHHMQPSATEEFNHNDGTTMSSGGSCLLWSGSNALTGTALLSPYPIEYGRTATGSMPTSSAYNQRYRISHHVRAPPIFST
jgi:hypothetical protein